VGGVGDAGRRADQGNIKGENLTDLFSQTVSQKEAPKFGASFFK